MDKIQILQECYTRVTLIPVIGSGLSVPFGLPDWRTLIEKAAGHFGMTDDNVRKMTELLNQYQFVDAVEVILDGGVSEMALQQYVSDCMLEAKKAAPNVSNNYTDIAKLSKVRYMTTNYDRYINDIVGAETFRLEELEHISVNQFGYSPYDHVVIPLHGEINRPDSIVLSRNSYDSLYASDCFHEEFQQLRTHFTFLFMGFSFEDEYVRKLFDKILQRFEAQHFILLEQQVERTQHEKIEQLKEKYGIEAVYYDASADGHTKAIRRWLDDIFQLRDNTVELADMNKLPEAKEPSMQPEEQAIVDGGRELIAKEKLTELYQLYWPEYERTDFYAHSIEFQVEVLCGLLWYFGFRRKDKEAAEIMEAVLRNPVSKTYKDRLAIMHAQLLWNTGEFDRAVGVLENYGGTNILAGLLLDILCSYKEQMGDPSGYLRLKEKYINGDTYNLKDLASYKDRESEATAYYWLGIAAGQLFQEHEEAIQYLLRAYELKPLTAVCEELANQYFAQGAKGIREVAQPKKYQLDMDFLLKAKIRFQYVMNFSDEAVVHSMYERSGFAFLQTLYWLRDFVTFYEFYEKSAGYIPESKDLILLKAQADADYEHSVDEQIIKKLDAKDRRYIEYCCALHRADLLAQYNPPEEKRIRDEILKRAEEEYPIEDVRVLQIVIDTAFFEQKKDYYEKLKANYPQKYFADMQYLGLEDELYGRLEAAEKKLKAAFETHKDYDGTFRILKSFYVRNRKKPELEALFSELIQNPPDEMYKQPQFYADRVMSEMTDWQNHWNAMSLYDQYYDRIKEDMFIKKELEEALKYHAADYSDYEDRIAWNRYMLTKAPKYARFDIYLSILRLLVANSKYKEASDVLDEMKIQGVPLYTNFDKLIYICCREQKKDFYCGTRPYYFMGKSLDAMLKEAEWHWRYRMTSFAAAGRELILPMSYLLCMFKQNRQKELSAIGKIHIMYSGLINLQNSLWSRENAFLRMVLQWIEKAENVQLAAPDFKTVCRYAPQEPHIEDRAEAVQLKLYSGEHPEYLIV